MWVTQGGGGGMGRTEAFTGYRRPRTFKPTCLGYSAPGPRLEAKPSCPSWGQDCGLPRESAAVGTHPQCSGTSAAPRTPAALRRGGEPSIRGGREGHAHASERQPRRASLSRARPTTSCAFVNYLLDLRLLRCALSGLFGGWGWCIGSCLGFDPHVCVNFFVGVLLFWMGKAGDEIAVTTDKQCQLPLLLYTASKGVRPGPQLVLAPSSPLPASQWEELIPSPTAALPLS